MNIDLYSSMQNLNRAAVKHAADIMKTGMRLPYISIPNSQYRGAAQDSGAAVQESGSSAQTESEESEGTSVDGAIVGREAKK